MSALGQKQNIAECIAEGDWHVRFVPKADMEVHSSTSSAIALGCFEKG